MNNYDSPAGCDLTHSTAVSIIACGWVYRSFCIHACVYTAGYGLVDMILCIHESSVDLSSTKPNKMQYSIIKSIILYS